MVAGVVAGVAWDVSASVAARRPAVASVAVAALSPTPSPTTPIWQPPVLAEPQDLARIEAPDRAELEAALTDTLLARTPIVVVAAPDGTASQVGVWLGNRLRAPLVPSAHAAARLSPELIVAVGSAVGPSGVPVLRVPIGRGLGPALTLVPETATAGVVSDPFADAVPTSADLSEVNDLLRSARPAQVRGIAVVRVDDRVAADSAWVARAAGFEVVATAASDLRADPVIGDRLRAVAGPTILVGSSGAWQQLDPEVARWQVAVVRRGLQLPGGGQVLFPHRRLVALYGATESAALGALGEQGPDAAADRVRDLAAQYDGLAEEPVVPTFEIIATVAAGGPGAGGDYSRRTDRTRLGEWIDVAEREGIYVVLDLQPGRTDFVTQAKEYEEFLRRPHVGLALDPEWRLTPDQVHLRQIGSVHVDEVNQMVAWLADLVREEALPQKLLIVHQFQRSMIGDRARLDTSRGELAVLIQMDGQGSQASKVGTYATITRDAPPGTWFGWKNFYDEDTPAVLGPAETYARDPRPWFVSYQ